MTASEAKLEALFRQVLRSKMGEPLPFYDPAERHADTLCGDDTPFAEDAVCFSALDLASMKHDLIEYAEERGIILVEGPSGELTPYRHAKPWRVTRDMAVVGLELRIGAFFGPEYRFVYDGGELRYSETGYEMDLVRDFRLHMSDRDRSRLERILRGNGVFEWQRDYCSEDMVVDGTQWTLLVLFDNLCFVNRI